MSGTPLTQVLKVLKVLLMSSKHVGIEQARKTLGDLVREAEHGTDIILTRGNSRRPVARITHLEDTMPNHSHTNVEESNRLVAEIDKQRQQDRGVETVYSAWNRPGLALSPEDYVAGALGEYAADYDIDALVVEFRDAVNAELPDGVMVRGDEVVGPLHHRPEFDLIEAVEAVDFWAIAAKHDRTATDDEPTATQTITTEHIRDLYDAQAARPAGATDQSDLRYMVLADSGDGEVTVAVATTAVDHGWTILYTAEDLDAWLDGTELADSDAEAIASEVNESFRNR